MTVLSPFLLCGLAGSESIFAVWALVLGVSSLLALPLIVACKAADLVFNSPFFALLAAVSLLQEIPTGRLRGLGWGWGTEFIVRGFVILEQEGSRPGVDSWRRRSSMSESRRGRTGGEMSVMSPSSHTPLYLPAASFTFLPVGLGCPACGSISGLVSCDSSPDTSPVPTTPQPSWCREKCSPKPLLGCAR